jgi:predicted DNA-binding antitoxin AbrB/MazE fold protein
MKMGGVSMYTIGAIYEGNHFKLKEPVPVKERYEVVITFTRPLKQTQEDILQFFNIWDTEDVHCISEIIKERDNFSLGRTLISNNIKHYEHIQKLHLINWLE